jgi:hypothetical protein
LFLFCAKTDTGNTLADAVKALVFKKNRLFIIGYISIVQLFTKAWIANPRRHTPELSGLLHSYQ